MHINVTRVIVASGIVLIAFGVWSWILPPQPTAGYKLFSIQKLPEQAEICLPQETVDRERQDDLLLAMLRGGSVYAAAQAGLATAELNRQPIRRIWDTDPSYGSIAFEPRLG